MCLTLPFIIWLHMDIRKLIGQMSVSTLLDMVASPDISHDLPKVIQLYQLWLSLNPAHVQSYVVHFNLGVSYASICQDKEAVHYYQLALAVKPDLHEARLNLGTCFERLGQVDQTMMHWQVVLDATQLTERTETQVQHRVLALNNLGRVLEGLKQYRQAEHYYSESLSLTPDQPFVIQHWVHMRQRQCAWPVFSGLNAIPIETKWQHAGQLALLALTDDPMIQLKASHRFLLEKFPKGDIQPMTLPHLRYQHKKIRIGYVSSDIANHPVALLTVPLFELANREQFTIYLYSWGNKDRSAIRQRVLDAADYVLDADALSDAQLAQRIREDEIDILMDLNGLTSGARPQMLYYRPAPIQITYLGFPGPYAHPCIDYVFVDSFLMPSELVPYFPEKPLYLPRVFQVSDDKRLVSVVPTYAECGLSEGAVVLAAFNNNYKFTPDVFAVWLRVLKAAPNAILWLLADNQTSQENMRAMATCYNIAPERIVFADRVSPEDYLARYHLVDLFLDTYPFNAGTTANDALYMGVPVLTLSGRSFASRMAGALLHALEMDELITYNLPDYEQQASLLAQNPEHLLAIRQKLHHNKQRLGIMNSQKMVNDIESCYHALLGI